MELKELLYRRQSIRRFTSDDVANDDLREIIDAARVAPSEKNLQNWHFIAIKSKELIDRIAEAVRARNEEISSLMEPAEKERADKFRKFVGRFTLFFTEAPVLIVVMVKGCIPTGYAEYELAGADPSKGEELLKRDPAIQSIGAAVENLTLRAFDLGYGLCWLSSANYAADSIEAIVRKNAGFDKDGYFMAALLALGVPEEGAKSPQKKDLSEIWTLVE